MGLSVKWASCNVGAVRPEGNGCYFAWGEVNPKSSFSWDTYYWLVGGSDASYIRKYHISDGRYASVWYNEAKFCGDGFSTLQPSDDAATVNLGSSWRTPTKEEWEELLDYRNCKWTWTEDYNGGGVNGYVVMSRKTGNSIFLPAAGLAVLDRIDCVNSKINYWSSTLKTTLDAYILKGTKYRSFDLENRGLDSSTRQLGCPIRAVCP